MTFNPAAGFAQAYAFGEGNPALTAGTPKSGKDMGKRNKPKSNIVKSNSSFLSRVIPHEQLSKRLPEHDPSGIFAFANIQRAFHWLDLSAAKKADNLTKVLFTKAHALCHSVNQITKSASHMDIVMGFSTADLIWYEPLSQRYSRLNKNGVINQSPVTAVHWVPGSENLFCTAQHDGSVIVYDKEKEDAPFVAEEFEDLPEKGSSGGLHSAPIFHVKKSVMSRNQKSNPVAYWKVSNSKINSFAFGPDGRHIAVVSEDGTLRIIDYIKEQCVYLMVVVRLWTDTHRLLDVFTSYYGGLICVCWSPDGRYVLTGGQDDLVSIWSIADSSLVARCQGHNSWITDVAFDAWRCDETSYRFGSVGQDCRLLLWDFSVGMLHRPRAVRGHPRAARELPLLMRHAQASIYQRGSISSYALAGRKGSQATITHLRSASNLALDEHEHEDDEDVISHPVQPRAATASLPPVMSKVIDEKPLSGLWFEEDCIITTSEGGIRMWDRPKDDAGAGQDGV